MDEPRDSPGRALWSALTLLALGAIPPVIGLSVMTITNVYANPWMKVAFNMYLVMLLLSGAASASGKARDRGSRRIGGMHRVLRWATIVWCLATTALFMVIAFEPRP